MGSFRLALQLRKIAPLTAFSSITGAAVYIAQEFRLLGSDIHAVFWKFAEGLGLGSFLFSLGLGVGWLLEYHLDGLGLFRLNHFGLERTGHHERTDSHSMQKQGEQKSQQPDASSRVPGQGRDFSGGSWHR